MLIRVVNEVIVKRVEWLADKLLIAKKDNPKADSAELERNYAEP